MDRACAELDLKTALKGAKFEFLLICEPLN